MKTVTIEELDATTSKWLREASKHDQVIITDHGKPMVSIQPAAAIPTSSGGYRNRKLLPEYEAVMGKLGKGTDSTWMISEDRDRQIG